MSNCNSTLTPERVREILHYDLETGIFTRRRLGKIAGTENDSGYLVIGLDGKYYRAHRLAWLYVYGEWPTELIDHKNRIRTDNRIDNLRQSNRSENTQNTVTQRSSSGVRGVSRMGEKWKAQIAIDGKDIYLGLFRTVAEASAAYSSAAAKLHTRNPLAA